ncbi:hypothetical protein OBV_16960 [Oscillibacter valericigenes Sjm18-20]|nr:hypothetical protein OBV_16960 [Oscillibacter valericigenes Sjm18-20]
MSCFQGAYINVAARPRTIPASSRAWAEEKGILTGYSDGTKRYKAYCTREQMVIFLNQLWKLIAK